MSQHVNTTAERWGLLQFLSTSCSPHNYTVTAQLLQLLQSVVSRTSPDRLLKPFFVSGSAKRRQSSRNNVGINAARVSINRNVVGCRPEKTIDGVTPSVFSSRFAVAKGICLFRPAGNLHRRGRQRFDNADKPCICTRGKFAQD